MDEQLNRLIDDYMQKKRSALEAEERMWRHLAEQGMKPTGSIPAPQPPLRPRKGLQLRPSQRYAIAGVAVLALAVAAVLWLARPARPAAYARIGGKETTRADIIVPYVSGKLQKTSLRLSGILNPLDNLHKAKQGGKISSETLEHAAGKIYNIYDNLPLTINRHEEINDSTHVPLPAGNGGERPNA